MRKEEIAKKNIAFRFQILDTVVSCVLRSMSIHKLISWIALIVFMLTSMGDYSSQFCSCQYMECVARVGRSPTGDAAEPFTCGSER